MKLNKMTLPLMIALAAIIATTGCKKGFNKVTPLPGEQSPVGDTGSANTMNNGGQLPTDTGGLNTGTGPVLTGGGPLTSTWDASQVDQDPAALADQTVYFAYDSAAVLTKEQDKLVIVSEKLKSDPTAKLIIEGHCDERGTEEYNRALGERRALALREALVAAGIDPDRVHTISYGKDKPADPGHDESAWSKNRRGVFILCHPKAGA